MTKTSDSIPAGENLGCSPFRRDERDLRITEEDALLLKEEPLPLKILVDVKTEECLDGTTTSG
jgi:hypothetical protein